MRTMTKTRVWLALGWTLLGAARALHGQSNQATSAGMTGNFLRIVGTKTPSFPGESTEKIAPGQHNVLAYEHEMAVTMDAAGQPTGKVQHRTFRIVKLLNAATPLISQALVTNENLSDVTMTMTTTDANGTQSLLMTYKLTNARVVQVRSWTPNNRDASSRGYVPAEEVAFTYTKLTVTHHPSGNVTIIDRMPGN